VTELPEQIRRQLDAEEARDRRDEERYRADMEWLESVGLRAPDPPRSPAEAFTQRMAEERRAEERREARARELQFLNPSLDVADPLRDFAGAQRIRRRMRQRRGIVP
jgi:hypothetical protein